MKLEQLQHLVAIVEHGSLRAASRRLQIPQPALTRSVRTLEKELGGAVFLRETTGMVLTELGRRFHVRASTIIHEARRALDEIAQHSGDDRGTVVVALSIMPHVGMLPYALKAFRQRYPKVRMQLIEGLFPDAESGLRDGTIDFYLGAAPRNPPAPGLAVQKLFDNTRTVVCRKGHPLVGCRSLKELAGADWATTAVDYDAADDLLRLFSSHGLAAPQVVLQARSAMSVMVALAHSDLLAMLPVQWGEFPLTRDTLQAIPLAELLPAPAIVLVRRPDLPLTPAAEFLCDVLLRHGPASTHSK
ncbi:MAG: LysR substrate-binding domain-containing protein [Burkholderiales bacterium]|nr:LysR substrate-binding domain-containing protein [Burkholderiales bacterium]